MPLRSALLPAMLLVAGLSACGSLEAGDDDTLQDVVADDAADGAADLSAEADAGADAEAGADADADAETPADVPGDAEPACGPFPGGGCAATEVCDIRSCLDGASGVCVARPDGCYAVDDPVCGCDGVTYGNDCERLRAGAALAYAGACGSGSLCGGLAGFRCPDGEACDIHGCWPDASGTCVPAHGSCDTRYDPVCGCDGTTYGNDCARLLAGAALDHAGACETAPTCVPECRPAADGGSNWVDPCTGALLCEAACIGCTAECQAVGSYSEGWYAVCSGSAGGGCRSTGSSNLIEWADCAP
ncbi:MAG: hypothetical protein JXB32_00160 [Deltaproteobacteria bacterium]|nr:hypothetical protein [Deltaproteobacteria bacterium]